MKKKVLIALSVLVACLLTVGSFCLSARGGQCYGPKVSGIRGTPYCECSNKVSCSDKSGCQSFKVCPKSL